ncbi:MAG: TRAP transporter small permease [Peptococcaceae bacterium]|nr:TRAP transporter small permease [Peptococcaceae bacterium]
MPLGRLAEVCVKIYSGVITIPAVIAGIVLVGLMLVTTADVTLRYFFNQPIVGSNEISVSMMVCAGFLGQAWCAMKRRHIKVDLLVGNLPPKAQDFFDSFNYLIVAGLSALIAVESYKQALIVRRLCQESQLLGIPQFPFYLVITFSYLLLLLASIVLLFSSISCTVKGRRHD